MSLTRVNSSLDPIPDYAHGYPSSHSTYPTVYNRSVTGVSSVILFSNSDRRGAIFQNDSDETIYLVLDTLPSIRLNANGGIYEMTVNNLYLGEIKAYHDGAYPEVVKNLLVTEL